MPFSVFSQSKKSASSKSQSQPKSKSSKPAKSPLQHYSPAQVQSRIDQGYQVLSDSNKNTSKKSRKPIGAVLNCQI